MQPIYIVNIIGKEENRKFFIQNLGSKRRDSQDMTLVEFKNASVLFIESGKDFVSDKVNAYIVCGDDRREPLNVEGKQYIVYDRSMPIRSMPESLIEKLSNLLKYPFVSSNEPIGKNVQVYDLIAMMQKTLEALVVVVKALEK